jgi:hypothetical protein
MAGPARTSRLSPWGLVVLVSGLVIAAAFALLLVWNLASREKRVSSYSVRGQLNGVALDVGDADVLVAGGGARRSLGVEQTEHFAYGHDARTTRSASAGVFRLHSRCPATVLHNCSVSYRLVVPDNLPVAVRTKGGTVRFRGFRGSARVTAGSGDIDVDSFCGFSLDARSGSGSVTADASCPPQELSLRSNSGSVHAIVPPGRYRVDAESSSGSREVRGIAAVSDAPFSLDAFSTSGDVLVESRRP